MAHGLPKRSEAWEQFDGSWELFEACWHKLRRLIREGNYIEDPIEFLDLIASEWVNDPKSRFYIYG